jgi:hypothetical protein
MKSNERRAFKPKPRSISEHAAVPSRLFMSLLELDRQAARRSSGRSDLSPLEFCGHFCAHEFEKDANASSVVKMHKSTKGFSEGSRQDPNLLTDLEIVTRANGPEILSHYRFDDAVWHRYRLFNAHDQRCDAEGAVHGAPAISRKIKNKKNIAGKQRRQNGARFARMPNRAPHSRSKAAESKLIEVELRAVFPIGMHARHKPTFPSLQTQALANGAKLHAIDMFNWKAIQNQLLLKKA